MLGCLPIPVLRTPYMPWEHGEVPLSDELEPRPHMEPQMFLQVARPPNAGLVEAILTIFPRSTKLNTVHLEC